MTLLLPQLLRRPTGELRDRILKLPEFKHSVPEAVGGVAGPFMSTKQRDEDQPDVSLMGMFLAILRANTP